MAIAQVREREQNKKNILRPTQFPFSHNIDRVSHNCYSAVAVVGTHKTYDYIIMSIQNNSDVFFPRLFHCVSFRKPFVFWLD